MTAAAIQRAPALLDAVAPPERRGIQRDAVRMLVTDRISRVHTHSHFFDLPSVLQAGDLLVVNDSATLPAALPVTRANGERIALHVSTMIDSRVWMAEPRGTVRVGEELTLPGNGSAVMIAPVDPKRPRLWYATFALPLAMNAYLTRFGEPIRYGYITQRFPLSDYQTLFARELGSSEMPSAARPFTPRVVSALSQRRIAISTITLHSGVASFEAPETPASERFTVPHATAEAVNAARREGRRVIAVGSTVLRALESAARDGDLVAASGWTDLVIDERHTVKTVDGLLTGFHDASATHLWVLGSFLDRDLLGSAYDTAANHAYYRHEFGDVHLIL
jgi:S-adenosylmethionine:tRNA ribosyltransferase-isomerase